MSSSINSVQKLKGLRVDFEKPLVQISLVLQTGVNSVRIYCCASKFRIASQVAIIMRLKLSTVETPKTFSG